MSAWLTPLSLAGLVLGLAFFAITLRRPAHGVFLYAVLGATPPMLQIGAFSGRTISQGLLLAEALATALILGWLMRRPSGTPLPRAPFGAPMLAFVGVALLSLVVTRAFPDHGAEGDITFMVSVGQMLLILWPIGVYFVAADAIDDPGLIRKLHTAIIWLAVPQLVMPLLPESTVPYMVWAVTFGLFAAPMALARAMYSPSVLARLFYVAIALVPLVRGLEGGKAFLYVFVIAGGAVVLALRSMRSVIILGGIAAAVMFVVLFRSGGAALTAPLQELVTTERRQASWGGRAGRVELARDAVSIWQDAPLTGVGPGNSYVYMLKRSPIGTPHNQYLNILVEFGAVGLVVWVWFLVQVFRTGLYLYPRVRDPDHAAFVLGWFGVFGGMVVGSMTGDFMIHSIRNGGLELFSGYYLQWVLLGALVSIARFEQLPLSAPARVPVRAAMPVRRARPLPTRSRPVSSGRFGAEIRERV